MNFDFILECLYKNGVRKFTYSTKYMRTADGRPVQVNVRGPVTPADVYAIRNTADMDAEIIYHD